MRRFVWLALFLSLALPAGAQTIAQYGQPAYGQGQAPYQQQYQSSPYGQGSSGTQYSQPQQSPQADPSVPGQSSLPAGQYELINLGTGQKRFITVTAQGQMYEQDPPAVSANVQQPQAYPGGYPQGYAPQMGQAQGGGQQGQTMPPPIVGSALRGALGQYYNYKYGAPGGYSNAPAAMPGAAGTMGGGAAGYGYAAPGGGAPGGANPF